MANDLGLQVKDGKLYLNGVEIGTSGGGGSVDGSIDLLKDARLTKGYLVDGILSTQLYRCTDYIRVDTSFDLKLSGSLYYDAAVTQMIAFYADKSEESYISSIASTTGRKTYTNTTIAVPQGAKWMRMCGYSASEINAATLTCSLDKFLGVLQSQLGDIRTLQPARFLLPRYMDVAVGRQCDFWVDDYISNPIGLPIRYYEPSGVTRYDNGHLRITPSSVGSVDLVLNTFSREDAINISRNQNDALVGSQTMTIRKVASSGASGDYNILIIGDSLVAYGNGANPVETYKLLAEDADVTFHQIGTRTVTDGGVTYRHEGLGGTTWAWYVSGNADSGGNRSPFVYNGELDFKQYMTDFLAAHPNEGISDKIDFCVIMLGTNDNADYVEGNSKTFINALLEDYPGCKVAVGIPALGGTIKGYLTSFEDRLRRIGAMYLDLYDNGKYNENVTCVGQGCWIDREHDYPRVAEANAVPYTPYSEDTFRPFDTGGSVHPSAQGYKQWGRAVYCKIRSWIAGDL